MHVTNIGLTCKIKTTMTICLVDTSTSMGKCFKQNEIKSNGKEKCYSSPIDIARIILEEGLKVVGKHHSRSVALFQTGNIKCLSCGFGTPISIIEEKVKALVPQCSVDDADIYTYPLSFIYNISYQYRIRNNTDRFSFGRSPFINEPLDIIIITCGSTLQGGINMTNISKYPCMGNDLSEGPSKWDHTVHLFVINTVEICTQVPPQLKSKSHLIGNSWVQTWRAQLDDYVRKLPRYYYLPSSRMMKRLGLPFPNLEYNLNKNFIKRMRNWRPE